MYKHVRTAIGFLTIIFVLGAFWLLYPKSPPVVQGTIVATINYSDEGYEPREVHIRAGEAVQWVNTSTQGTWPASSVHPTHSIYPGKSDSDCLGSSFDSCRELQGGEKWTFTFLHPGEWRFHDHVHPSKTGVIYVDE